MPSPFPGMDPYLECYAWRDFHSAFNVSARTALRRLLGDRYGIFVEWDVFIHEPPADQRRRVAVADVAVNDRRPVEASSAPSVGTLLAPSHATIAVDLVAERQWRVEVRDRNDDRLVTVIELLSPTNKVDDGRAVYLNKRQNYLLSGVNLVEIDLLRAGRPMPMSPPPSTPYYALVARPGDEGVHDLWPVRLRETLPIIPIPLSKGDADVPLELQSLADAVYDEAGYGERLYDRELEPPLSSDDAAWAAGLLREAGVTRPVPAGT